MCAYSNVSYVMGSESNTLSSVSSVCENDPYVYQACGFYTKSTKQSDFLCGGYFSDDSRLGVNSFVACNLDCGNNSSENSSLSITDSSNNIECDDKCDTSRCKDESECSGRTYGVNCVNDYYLPVSSVCDRVDLDIIEKCTFDQENERDCDVENTTLHTCLHYNDKVSYGKDTLVPILNYTRCGVFNLRSSGTFPYCYNYLDQTNCTDVNRVGGYCLISGYMSSVSKYVVCGSEFKRTYKPVNLCDDNLENECDSPSGLSDDCLVHKHKLCDGVSDCVDGSDETFDICHSTTLGYLNCSRTFNADKNMPIPIAWLLDNQRDCLNGEDVKGHVELTHCGEIDEGSNRVHLGNKTCQDVLLCPGDSENSFVEFSLLCDGIKSCEVENEICAISRDFPSINTSAAIKSCAVRDLCESMQDSEDLTCHIQEFENPAGNAFGVRMKMNVPTAKINCNSQFGEYYVFLSCMGLCLNTTCPLQNTPLDLDSCPGQYPGRVYTLANNKALTFVTMSDVGEYENAYFQCENNKCIKYSQVCNLVDDCGDLSDERTCTNHLVCDDTKNQTDVKKYLISHSQMCDGRFDCFDLSDECNLSCGKEILANWALKLSCWLLGLLATIFNVIMVTKVGSFIRESKSGSMLCTRVLVCMIGLGDLLIGLYLIILSVFDSIIFGKDYCAMQAEWLSGTACSVLGVISTTGSQLSLFSMTALSLIRMWGIMNSSMIAPTHVNKRAVTKAAVIVIGIVTASISVAIIPLIPALEDYFVQGMFYDPDYKLFIGFPNKIKHINILGAYYKNESFSADSSWAEIGEKVDGMFSQSYGSINKMSVHFYGNDGVCLFKYFVRSDDPRRSRTTSDVDMIDVKGDMIVWLMLGVNLFCFVVITLSYLLINIKTRKSSKNSGQNNNTQALRKSRAMQNRIAIIIATDFACWVPFIIICGLHNLGSIDATYWYVTFAMIVLPLNSVINPLLYDNTLREFFSKIVQSFAVSFSNGVRYLRALRDTRRAQTQVTNVIEGMAPLAPTDDIIMETPM